MNQEQVLWLNTLVNATRAEDWPLPSLLKLGTEVHTQLATGLGDEGGMILDSQSFKSLTELGREEQC